MLQCADIENGKLFCRKLVFTSDSDRRLDALFRVAKLPRQIIGHKGRELEIVALTVSAALQFPATKRTLLENSAVLRVWH